jgi:hypothetical protein
MEETSAAEVLTTMLKMILVSVILFWFFIEYLDYIPTANHKYRVFIEKFQDLHRREPNYNLDNTGINRIPDTSILRNTRVSNSDRIFSNYRELDYYQMNKILQDILISYKNKKTNIESSKVVAWVKSKDTTFSDSLYFKIKEYFFDVLNEQVRKSEFASKYHDYISYNIDSLVLKHKDNSGNLTRYHIDIIFSRQNKTHKFAVNTIIITNKETNTFIINDLQLIGIPLFNIIEKKENNQGIDIGNTKINSLELANNISLENPTKMLDKLFDNDATNVDVQQELQKYKKTQKDEENRKKYRCFHPKGKDGELPFQWELECTSYHNDIKDYGIWDGPCQKDKDCPFYKANKNYPNNFGRCIDGLCQLPMGLERIGFTKYNNLTKPMCYNCNNISNEEINEESDEELYNGNTLNNLQCCQRQENMIKNGLSKIKSPDYMFENDSIIRKQNQTFLKEKDLQVNPTL